MKTWRQRLFAPLAIVALAAASVAVGPVNPAEAVPAPCVGNVVIGSQAEMDAFNCSVVTGYLLIDSVADLTNVDALSVLTAVDGALYVRSNPLLANVDGLSSLVTGGNLSVFISDNPLITDLDGLSSLQNVKQNLVITGNAALTNVDGLSSLFRVGSVIVIENNAVLADLDGLSSLSQPPYGGYIHIDGNPSLVNVDGLSAMTATGELEITNNAALTNLNGLSGLTELRGDLTVTGNSVLGRCSSLFSLLDGGLVGGSVSISGNAAGCRSAAEILADLGVDRTVAAHFLSNSCPLRPLAEPIGAGVSATFAVPAGCGVPGEADAVLVSLWAVDPVAEGNLRLGPAGTESTLGVVNFGANGLENTNSLWVPLSAAGELELGVNGGAAAPGTVLAAAVQLEILGWSGRSTEPGLLYHSVNPCAFFDSRGNQGSASPGPHAVGEGLVVELAGGHPAGQGGGQTDCGVPVGAAAALVNFTLLQPTGEIGLADNTTGASLVFNEPLSAPFNNASAVVVPLDANGSLSIDVIGSTGAAAHVRSQVLGYFDDPGIAGGLIFNPTTPCVAFDSRTNQNATGVYAGQRAGGAATTYDVVGVFDPAQGGGNSDCGVPADAEAVELSFVGVNAVREGNLRVSAAGVVPEGGVLNFGALVPKMNNANAAVVPVSADGEIDVFMNGGIQGSGQLIADVRGTITGYYTRSPDSP